jgi:hypothetical protein
MSLFRFVRQLSLSVTNDWHRGHLYDTTEGDQKPDNVSFQCTCYVAWWRVFTARYALSPSIKQIRFVLKGLIPYAQILHLLFCRPHRYCFELLS